MKKKSPEQQKAELKHMLFQNSPYISNTYPNIKSIEVKIQFTDPDDRKTFEKN